MRKEAERMAALVSALPRGMQRAASHAVPQTPKSGGTAAPDCHGGERDFLDSTPTELLH